jgi:hypothetical protein
LLQILLNFFFTLPVETDHIYWLFTGLFLNLTLSVLKISKVAGIVQEIRKKNMDSFRESMDLYRIVLLGSAPVCPWFCILFPLRTYEPLNAGF